MNQFSAIERRGVDQIRSGRRIPEPGPESGGAALIAMIRERSVLAALRVFHRDLGDVFRIRAGAFQPIVMAGPEAARFVLVTARDQLSWRPEGDPVARLLRHGVLIEDGAAHDSLRRAMNPALHKQMLGGYVDAMVRSTDEIANRWQDHAVVDMLPEMRRAALLIFMRALLNVDFSPDMERILPAILKSLAYISPGLWVIWPGVPRPGYTRALRELDGYLYGLIAMRRRSSQDGGDLMGLLLSAGMDDSLIRDQLLTMLIAGHDTSTALLAWTLYLLGRHPEVLAKVRAEINTALGEAPPTLDALNSMPYLGQVINETMRLYPPIHLGNRIATEDLEFQGYHIPALTRVVYSIYLTHRHPAHWSEPDQFDPERFAPDQPKPDPYVYLPFGGGPRSCIGRAFALVESKIVLSRLIQTLDFELVSQNVHQHMGATLEPRPGVRMRILRRG